MNILLTGAAGFLGSHLTQRLLAEGHNVLGLDDLSTGKIENIGKFLENPNFRFITHDVRQPYEFNQEFDAILNFACPASPKHYQIDPVKTIETNFLGIINLLHLAHDSGAILIQASTSEVYGDPNISPQSEEYWGNVNPIGVRSCYDEGKRAAETLCFDYKRQYEVDTRVIRIFNTYGPNMSHDDGRVVSNFIYQALSGIDLTIFGNGSQSRSFCYVDDLVEGIYRVLLSDQFLDTPINLGNPHELSMLEVAKLVLKLTNSESKIKFLPLPADDPQQRCPDISKATKVLGWIPEVDITKGLAKTIEYFRASL